MKGKIPCVLHAPICGTLCCLCVSLHQRLIRPWVSLWLMLGPERTGAAKWQITKTVPCISYSANHIPIDPPPKTQFPPNLRDGSSLGEVQLMYVELPTFLHHPRHNFLQKQGSNTRNKWSFRYNVVSRCGNHVSVVLLGCHVAGAPMPRVWEPVHGKAQVHLEALHDSNRISFCFVSVETLYPPYLRHNCFPKFEVVRRADLASVNFSDPNTSPDIKMFHTPRLSGTKPDAGLRPSSDHTLSPDALVRFSCHPRGADSRGELVCLYNWNLFGLIWPNNGYKFTRLLVQSK